MTAKKKLAGAFGGIVVIGATVALTAGTFSYFSDSSSKQVGEVQFGTLDLVPQEGAASAPFTVSEAKPGDVVLEQTDFSFRNAGTMDGELRISFVPTYAEKTTAAQKEAFDDAVLITLAGVPGFVNGQAYTLDKVATATADGLRIATLGHGAGNDWAIKGFPVTVTIDPKAGNAVQGVKGGFKLVADLVQGDEDGYAEFPDPDFPAAPATQP